MLSGRRSHILFESEEVAKIVGERFGSLLVAERGVWVGGVVKFDDVKSAAIDVEMQVSAVEIGREGFPNAGVRVQLFDGAPDALADAFAVHVGADREKIEVIVLGVGVDVDHCAAHHFALDLGFVGDGARGVERLLDVGERQYEAVERAKLGFGGGLEGRLEVGDELRPMFGAQGGELDVGRRHRLEIERVVGLVGFMRMTFGSF